MQVCAEIPSEVTPKSSFDLIFRLIFIFFLQIFKRILYSLYFLIVNLKIFVQQDHLTKQVRLFMVAGVCKRCVDSGKFSRQSISLVLLVRQKKCHIEEIISTLQIKLFNHCLCTAKVRDKSQI